MTVVAVEPLGVSEQTAEQHESVIGRLKARKINLSTSDDDQWHI